jgi:multicomponent Na+:H+ antiporter subunit C
MIFVIGLYVILSNTNYVSKIFGLSIMQSSVLVFYTALGKVHVGIPPYSVGNSEVVYSNPLPHVLMLTAIVVGFALNALAISFAKRIYKNFGSVDSNFLAENQ